MRTLLGAAVFSALAAAPAGAITRQQAVDECRAIHANPAGLRVAERTGVTIQQQVKRCVQGKMKRKK